MRSLPWHASLFAFAAIFSSFARPIAAEKIVVDRIEGPWRVDVRAVDGLEYLLVEPSDVPKDAVLPTIVVLHGRGARARVPDPAVYRLSTPVRILVPRAPDPKGRGFEWLPVTAAHGETPLLLDALDARRAQLARAMRSWRRLHRMPGAPIAVGFSQGGILAVGLALEDRVSRAIAMGSWYPPSCVPLETGAPITMLHGREDEVLDAERTRALVETMRARGHDASFEPFEGVGHEVPPPMAARLRALLEDAVREAELRDRRRPS